MNKISEHQFFWKCDSSSKEMVQTKGEPEMSRENVYSIHRVVILLVEHERAVVSTVLRPPLALSNGHFYMQDDNRYDSIQEY